ncbi:MAG TPA: hypothetical protein VL117_00855 [Thermoleophilia bacterium]|nr:hypothetical protein [Thermoleophilia bacterium]
MCFFGCLGLFAPRLVLLFLWIFTNLVDRAFSGGFIAPLIGIVFLPFTTLFYVLAWAPATHVSGIGWAFVVFGLLLDLGSYSSSYRDRGRLARR